MKLDSPGRTMWHRAVGARLPRILGVVVGIGASMALVASTNSYFGDEATTGTDSWATGAVTITEDVAGEALFSASNIAPGYSDEKTVTVTNASTIEDPNGVLVRFYARNLTGSAPLAAALDVTVVFNDGVGDTTIYSGTLADLEGNWSDYANEDDHTGWLSAGGPGADPTATYTITVSFPDDGDQSDLETATAGATLVWEARSTGSGA